MFQPWPTRRAAWSFGATLLLLAGCGARPEQSENVPGVPVFPGAVLVDRWEPVDAPTDDPDANRDPTDFYSVAGVETEAIVDWYRQQMALAGWVPISDPGDEVVLYQDAAGCHAFVVVTPAEEGVDLQISRQNPNTPCVRIPTLPPGDR